MKKKILISIVIGILVVVILGIIIKYFVKSDTNIPFQISKITVVSGVDGEDKGKSEEKWNLNIMQNNDIHIDIANINDNEIIDRIIIDNFEITKVPTKGNIHIYKPSNRNSTFKNSEEYKVENEVIFTENETLNQISLRFANEYLVNYQSNDDSIVYDGSLLEKVGITQEEIEFKILFDVSIELKSGKRFKTTIMLEIPNGDIVQEQISTYEINSNEIVFKEY